MSRPRPTLRTRLTLLYTGLFAGCGAIVVAVSYTLVARLPAPGQGPQPSFGSVPGNVSAQCRAEHLPHKQAIVQCIDDYLQQVGAQRQRALTLSHLLQYSLITLAVVLAFAAILGWIISGRALRPVHLITAAARAASEDNLSARVAPSGPHDELRELAETFDEMLGRLEAAFEGQRQFIANASHELRTPLAVMRTTIDVVLGNPASTPDDLRGMAADIRAAVDHAEHLIGALLILARNERGLTVHEDVDLATAAEDVLDIVGQGDRRIHATLEPAVITGDPVLAERLIANLVDNAVRYNHAAGDVWISTGAAGGSSVLTVTNTGPVISPADADRIFEPFQRLCDRTSHDGSGLGLAIVASIAAVHGGTATACPRQGGGLTVTVMVPSAGEGSSASRTIVPLGKDAEELGRMKVGVFLHGTSIMHGAAAGVGRDERVAQVRRRDPSVADFLAYVPTPGSTEKLMAWASHGATIVYLSSHRRQDDIHADESVIRRHGFPPGPVYGRREGQDYGPLVAQLGLDVLVEDDCQSIGGAAQTCEAQLSGEARQSVRCVVLPEFGGLADLPDDPAELFTPDKDAPGPEPSALGRPGADQHPQCVAEGAAGSARQAP